jgi:uncharacterized protein
VNASVPYTSPGVYVQELPSLVHKIAGVATSLTALLGCTARGIDRQAQTISSFGDFQPLYGGHATDRVVSDAVTLFYQNAPGQEPGQYWPEGESSVTS